MKLNRCHSANPKTGIVHTALIALVISNKKKPLNPRVPLGPPPAAKECKDKDSKSLLRKKQDLALYYKAGK